MMGGVPKYTSGYVNIPFTIEFPLLYMKLLSMVWFYSALFVALYTRDVFFLFLKRLGWEFYIYIFVCVCVCVCVCLCVTISHKIEDHY